MKDEGGIGVSCRVRKEGGTIGKSRFVLDIVPGRLEKFTVPPNRKTHTLENRPDS